MKKDPNQSPATKADIQTVKADIQTVKTDLQTATADLRKEIAAARMDLQKEIGKVDAKVNRLAFETVAIRNDLNEVKTNMMTKEDKNEIINTLDKVVGQMQSFENSLVIRGHWMQDHSEKIDDHEKRIKRLEEAPSPS